MTGPRWQNRSIKDRLLNIPGAIISIVKIIICIFILYMTVRALWYLATLF